MDPSRFESARSSPRARRKKPSGSSAPPVTKGAASSEPDRAKKGSDKHSSDEHTKKAPSVRAHSDDPAAPALRVLLVEDRPGDARLLEETLVSVAESRFDLTWVERLGDARRRLAEEEFDAVLLDLSLPDSDGLETFLTLHGEHPGVPIVVLTGLSDESIAVTAVQEGAQDYLVKGPMNGDAIARSIRYAIERGRLLAQVAEVRLREHSVFREVNRLKSDMIAFVAHEFQQTLNAFNDHAESLASATPEQMAEIAEEIRVEVDTEMKRLTSLIESFLEISESDQPHTIELSRELFDVRAMVEESLKLAEAAAAKCTFKVEFGEGVDTVHADRERTMQVLINLLANADHYSSRGASVRVRVVRENEHLRFEVKNPRSLPRDRVRALPHSRMRDGRRLDSIGAHSSTSLIEAQGGRFGVRSQRGEGTTFYFTLPV